MGPSVSGEAQTDFVISRCQKPNQKMCALDIVNAAAYLAFLDRETAKDMEFSTEHFYARVLESESKEEVDELVSIYGSEI